jgi:hypothetical protein
LKHSLKRYEDLHVDIEGDAGGDGKLLLQRQQLCTDHTQMTA